MTDIAADASSFEAKQRWARSQQSLDTVFRIGTGIFAVAVLLLLGGVIVALIEGALPALQKFGFNFLVTQSWNPVTENFGAMAPIYGTLVTSAIAMVIGIPISFGIALFITELCPGWLKRPIGTAIELLAAIPSIVPPVAGVPG